MPELGETLGRYTLLKRLAAGGMGEIYLAARMGPLGFAPPVALKVLRDELASDTQFIEMLVDEAKISMFLNHQNVVSVLDFGEDHGRYYIAMELVQGVTLKAILDGLKAKGRRLDVATSIYITNELCRALKYAHTRTNHAGEPLNIVHRDVTPANVLISVQGEVKLTDFGIARAKNRVHQTQAGVLKGKFAYMSPEQARGEAVDHRVDVYAMGCILFQLVTGRVPFEADNFMGVLSLHLTEPPPSIPPEVFDRIGAPRELAAVIDRALLKDKNQRWNTIDDLANAVRMVCGDPIPSASVHMQKAGPVVPAGPGAKTAGGVTGGVAVPATTTQSRQKTKWTGNLSVPEEEDKPKGKSKLPLILGLVLVLGGGAAAAAFFVMNSNKGGDDNGSGSSGSAIAQNGSDGSNGSAGTAGKVTPPPPQAIDAGVAPPPQAIDAGEAALPPPPAMITFKIDSVPRGAEVTNLATGKKYGSTPVTLNIKGSHDTLSFQIHKNGYGDSIIDVTPDSDGSFTAKLEKGASSAVRQTVVLKPGDAVTKPDGPGTVTKPDGGNPTKPKPDAGVAKPPDEDECVDMPCVKTNVPGLKNGSAGGS